MHSSNEYEYSLQVISLNTPNGPVPYALEQDFGSWPTCGEKNAQKSSSIAMSLKLRLLPRRFRCFCPDASIRCRLQKRKQRHIGKKFVVWRPSSCGFLLFLPRPLPPTPAAVERLWTGMPHQRPQEVLGVLRHRGEGNGLLDDHLPLPKMTRVLLPPSLTTSTAQQTLLRGRYKARGGIATTPNRRPP